MDVGRFSRVFSPSSVLFSHPKKELGSSLSLNKTASSVINMPAVHVLICRSLLKLRKVPFYDINQDDERPIQQRARGKESK